MTFVSYVSVSSNYYSRPSMSSTPVARSRFDPRTYTRPSPTRGEAVANLTFDKETTNMLANLTFDKDSSFDLRNNTFTHQQRLSRDSSEALEDDRLSTVSDNSNSHNRLNDVGDVQNLARLQEESKF
jgi:hypothetical protein